MFASFFRPHVRPRFCLILGSLLKPQIDQNAPKLRSKIDARKLCVQCSVSGRFLSISDPHQSSKVSFSLKRGAHFHIFTRSPFLGRLGPKSLKNESKNDPKIHQNPSKTPFWTHRFSASFLASIFSQKWLQNGTPKWCPELLFGDFLGVHFSHAFLLAPRLHFGVLLASF